MRLRSLRATLLLALAMAMIAALAPTRTSAATYSVLVNEGAIANPMAELRNGQLMVAVRPLVEAMGGQVTWSAANQQIGINHNGSQIALWIGTQTAFQDGTRLWAPVSPYLKNGSTMVPAWWLATRMGAKVSFSGSILSIHTVTPPTISDNRLLNAGYVFPYPQGVPYQQYYDDWNAPRYFQGDTSHHEGTDLLADKGTPVVAVAAGTVVRYGWNTLGGYRVTIQLDDYPEYRFYYAHMDRYAPGMGLGVHVKAGQLLGYVGNTGEGPERTEGKFVTHLHFGIYHWDTAINPYPFLKSWEAHKAPRP